MKPTESIGLKNARKINTADGNETTFFYHKIQIFG